MNEIAQETLVVSGQKIPVGKIVQRRAPVEVMLVANNNAPCVTRASEKCLVRVHERDDSLFGWFSLEVRERFFLFVALLVLRVVRGG
jgi:hypothetical protein